MYSIITAQLTLNIFTLCRDPAHHLHLLQQIRALQNKKGIHVLLDNTITLYLCTVSFYVPFNLIRTRMAVNIINFRTHINDFQHVTVSLHCT